MFEKLTLALPFLFSGFSLGWIGAVWFVGPYGPFGDKKKEQPKLTKYDGWDDEDWQSHESASKFMEE